MKQLHMVYMLKPSDYGVLDAGETALGFTASVRLHDKNGREITPPDERGAVMVFDAEMRIAASIPGGTHIDFDFEAFSARYPHVAYVSYSVTDHWVFTDDGLTNMPVDADAFFSKYADNAHRFGERHLPVRAYVE